MKERFMKRKTVLTIAALMLSALFLFGGVHMGTAGSFDHTEYASNEEELNEAIALHDSAEVVLQADIDLSETVVIPVGKRIGLSGSHSLIAQGDFTALTVEGELQILDVVVTRQEQTIGRGVYVAPEGMAILTGGQIRGHMPDGKDSPGWYEQGGGVYNAGHFIMESGTIARNGAHDGGGIFNIGHLEVDGGRIADNTALFVGGGIFNSGTALIKGGHIKYNVAQDGGGIYNANWRDADMAREMNGLGSDEETVTVQAPADEGTNHHDLTLSGGSISHNEAFNGGGVYNHGHFTIKGGRIVENSVMDYYYTLVNNLESGEDMGMYEREFGRGGGVYNIGVLDMTAGEVVRNKAIDGAGIFNTHQNVLQQAAQAMLAQANQNPQGVLQLLNGDDDGQTGDSGDGQIDGGNGDAQTDGNGQSSDKLSSGFRINRAGDDADADADATEAEATISGGIIKENVASRNGGGIYNTHVLTLTGGRILRNEAFGGGGIFNAAQRFDRTEFNQRNLDTDSREQMRVNVAADDAAGLAISGSGDGDGTLVVDGAHITRNKAMYGGGVYNGAEFAFKSGKINENTAEARTIYIQWGANAGQGSEITPAPGGGVYNAGHFEMLGGLIARNNAIDGAGVHSVLDIERLLLHRTAPEGYWDWARLTQANQAPQSVLQLLNGGGDQAGDDAGNGNGTDGDGNGDTGDSLHNYPFYYVSHPVYFDFVSGDIRDNVATGQGGGLYNGGQLRLGLGSRIVGNTASAEGGGIYLMDSIFPNLDISSENLSDAESRIRDADMTDPDEMLEQSDARSQMRNLGADDGDTEPLDEGDGDMEESVQHPQVVFEHSVIALNETGTSGGGIYHSGEATLTINFVEMDGNKAVEHGGGISMAGGAELILMGGLFKNNAAAFGGGISMLATLDGTDTNNLANLQVAEDVEFVGNEAGIAYNRLPADDALYQSNVLATAWTSPLTQGYNNLDIFYIGDPYTPPGDGNGDTDTTDPGGNGNGGGTNGGTVTTPGGDETSEAGLASRLPRTGDMLNILWLLLLLTGSVGAATYLLKKRSSDSDSDSDSGSDLDVTKP